MTEQGKLFDDLPAYVGPVSKHPAYRTWERIIERCHNPKAHNFLRYGGRGICVCDEWRGSSRAFVAWAIKAGYRPGLQIDRRNNERGYSPRNCRFVTHRENNLNRRDTVRLADGSAAWPVAQANGLSRGCFQDRLARGWSPDDAARLPTGDCFVWLLADGSAAWPVAQANGLSADYFHGRLRRGWSPDQAATIPKGGKRPLPDGFQSVGDAAARVVAATVAKIAQGESEAATLGDQAQRSAARRKPKAKGNGHA